jgi:molybdate transport repressor ModE-like protein
MVQKQTTPLDWADLGVMLAIARGGTFRAAAKALKVSHSTILRRLDALEGSLGTRLVERRSSGRFALTGAGQEAIEIAQQLEELVTGMQRRLDGRDLELKGQVHVTMPATFMPLIARELARFSEKYPRIEVTIGAGFNYVDLSQREADVALRVVDRPSPELIGRKIANVRVGIYGSREYLASQSDRLPLEKHAFIGWPSSLSSLAFARWMQKNVGRAPTRCRITQDWQLKEAVDANLGLAVLPCVLGDLQPHWRCIGHVDEISGPLWILTHRDLRSTARMRVFRDFITEVLTQNRELIEGERPIGDSSARRR